MVKAFLQMQTIPEKLQSNEFAYVNGWNLLTRKRN